MSSKAVAGAKIEGLSRAIAKGLNVPRPMLLDGDDMPLESDLREIVNSCPVIVRNSIHVPWENSREVSGIGISLIASNMSELKRSIEIVRNESQRSIPTEVTVFIQPVIIARCSGFLQVGSFIFCGVECESRIVLSFDGMAGISSGQSGGTQVHLERSDEGVRILGRNNDIQVVLSRAEGTLRRLVELSEKVMGEVPLEIEWHDDGDVAWVVQYQPL